MFVVAADEEVIVGKNVELSCTGGNSNVEWYYREKLDDSQQPATTVFQDTNISGETLTITTVSTNHEGYYHCEVNDVPEDPILLVVLGKLQQSHYMIIINCFLYAIGTPTINPIGPVLQFAQGNDIIMNVNVQFTNGGNLNRNVDLTRTRIMKNGVSGSIITCPINGDCTISNSNYVRKFVFSDNDIMHNLSYRLTVSFI